MQVLRAQDNEPIARVLRQEPKQVPRIHVTVPVPSESSASQLWAVRALIHGGGMARLASRAARLNEVLRGVGVDPVSDSYDEALARLRALLSSHAQDWERHAGARVADLAERFGLDDADARIVTFVHTMQAAPLLQMATDTIGPLTHAQSVGVLASIVDLPEGIVQGALSPLHRLVRQDVIRITPAALDVLRQRLRLGSAVAIELARSR